MKLKKVINKIKYSIFEEVEVDVNSKTTFSIFEVIVLLVIAILFGIVIGYTITFSRNPVNSLKTNTKLSEIINTYTGIVDNYYDEIDEDALGDAAIKGMIDSLDDPYSNYMDSITTKDFNETVDGSFVGIGVVLQYDPELEYNKIIDITKNAPAEKAGLKKNDILVKIDDEDVKGLFGNSLSKKISSKEGTKLTVTVQRDGKNKKFNLVTAVVELPSTSYEVFKENDKKIGYIKIDSFAANTYDQFKKDLKTLEKKNIDSLIIDVRDNPGGHLLQTREILSLFFNKKTVLYQISNKDNKEKIYSDTNDVRKYPIVVLINGGSASASEILASCFQDNYKKATIIGTKSYGKGTVQKSHTLSNGNSIKYTTQKWLTSKGKWLNEKGVVPDIVVEQGEDYYKDPVHEKDLILQEALKKLKES